jgi:predicted amidohydrolase YtcJ
MRMSEPYEGRPDDFGLLYMTEEEIHESVENAHRNDYQVAIHANGDVTINMVLDAYERVQTLWPKARYPAPN